MTLPRHVCPRCGKEVAQQGDVYWASDHAYVYLRRHNSAPGQRCRNDTVTVAKRLHRKV